MGIINVSDVESLTEPDDIANSVGVVGRDPDEDVICLGLVRGSVVAGGGPNAGDPDVRDIHLGRIRPELVA